LLYFCDLLGPTVKRWQLQKKIPWNLATLVHVFTKIFYLSHIQTFLGILMWQIFTQKRKRLLKCNPNDGSMRSLQIKLTTFWCFFHRVFIDHPDYGTQWLWSHQMYILCYIQRWDSIQWWQCGLWDSHCHEFRQIVNWYSKCVIWLWA